MTDFHYATGRIRALEARMLTASQITRMVNAPDFESAFSVLNETPYAPLVPKLKKAFDFEELFKMEKLETKTLLEKLAPDNPLLGALYRKDHYQDLKAQVKSQDPKIELDKRYYSELLKTARQNKVAAFTRLVNSKIDLCNLETLLRINTFYNDKKLLAKSLLSGGRITKDVWMALFARSGSEIVSRLNYTPYLPALSSGIEAFGSEGGLFLLERQINNYILEEIRPAKYLSFGIEPLLGFYLAKEYEAAALRFVFICKINQVPIEETKNRMRVSYV